MAQSFMPLLAALTASWLIVRAGIRKRAFEWRRPPRRCPSCRHAQRDCTCVK
jgi:hypothetical protein